MYFLFKRIDSILFIPLLVMIVVFGCSDAVLAGVVKTTVFRSGEDGYPIYRIPTIIRAGNGDLLAIAEGRASLSDTGDIDLVLKRSSDDGKTWGNLELIRGEGTNTAGNPAPVVDSTNGRIHLLYSINQNDVRVMTSDDNGKSWTLPKNIHEDVGENGWSWNVPGPVHGIQLERGPNAGRLVITGDHINSAGRWGAHVIYSDDQGANWQLGGVYTDPGNGTIRPNENVAEELVDGRLYFNSRDHGSAAGTRSVAYSSDGGVTYDGPFVAEPAIITPVVQNSIVRFAATDKGDAQNILIYSGPGQANSRRDMTIQVSFDEGVTWIMDTLIDPGPAAYSDLIKLDSDKIGVLYEAGDTLYQEILFSYFDFDDLDSASWNGINGDVDQNGLFNAADLDIFVAVWTPVTNEFYLGGTDSYTNGDLDFNGVNDLNDVFLMRQYVIAAGLSAASLDTLHPVPEPTSGLIVVIGGLPFLLGSRFQRTKVRSLRTSVRIIQTIPPCFFGRLIMLKKTQLFLVAAAVVAIATPTSADLVIHFDPNDIGTVFLDGNVGGGTNPVTGVGDPVRWITDVRSPTPGGGALDTFIDAQQAGTGATLANSLGGTVLNFAGNGNLLGFDTDIGGTIDGVLGAMDTNTATLILVGRADSGGSGLGRFLDMRDAGDNGGFGLQYNYATGNLEGLVKQTAVAATPLNAGEQFVATLVWDGPNAMATLDVSTFGGAASNTDPAVSAVAMDHDRFRLGSNAANSGDFLTGMIGDVYLYNDVLDHSDVSNLLVNEYLSEVILTTVDRATLGSYGNITFTNATSQPLTIVGYKFSSASGGLDPTTWTSIADTYDANNDQSVDSNDEWIELTNPSSRTDLSEFEPGLMAADGATIASLQSIDFGNVWIKNPAEDVKLELLLIDGTTMETSVTFSGGPTGSAFTFGDLDFDGDFDVNDFTGTFVPNYLTDTSSMSPAEKYQAGDFNEDGLTDFLDFLIYNNAFLAANPGAAALSFSAVPEPTSWTLFGLGGLILLARRRLDGWDRRAALRVSKAAFTMMIAVLSICLTLAAPTFATLVVQFDPNDISTLFQNGNVGGGTIPVTGVGDPVRWITDVRSPTPGGGALDTFVDVQQAGTGATLVDSAGGTILQFGGVGSLLGFDADIGGTIDGVLGAMDTNTATLVLVGQADSAGSGLSTFLDMRGGAGNNGGFGLQYNHDTGNLEALVDTAAVAATPLPPDQLFVATLAWNGPLSSASLKITTIVNQVLQTTTTNDAASNTAIDHDRFRLGRTSDFTNGLTGLIGDVLIYNDILDRSDVHDQLVLDYDITEPDLLGLEVNRTTGFVDLMNESGANIEIDGYRIISAMDSLDPLQGTGWNSLDDQNFDGAVWTELGGLTSELSEGSFGDSTLFADSESVSLGRAYDTAVDAQDLLFQFHVAGTEPDVLLTGNVDYVTGGAIDGDFDGDLDVDGFDFLKWQRGESPSPTSASDLADWQANFGIASGSAAVAAAVPEPTTPALFLAGLVGWFGMSVRRSGINYGAAWKVYTCVAIASVAWAVGGSAALATVTNDRFYQFGDDGLEDASPNITIGSGSGNVSPGQTLDSQGPMGAFVDLLVNGNPTYANVGDRPGAAANALGASFDGDGDGLIGFSVNAPSQMWDNVAFFPDGYPHNYEQIFGRGIQFWAKPDSATQGVRQDIIIDTPEHGVVITDSNTWGLVFDNGLFDSELAVDFNQWTHVMTTAGAGDPDGGASSFGGALYINGIAVAAQAAFYDPNSTDLSIGSNQDASGNYYHGLLDDLEIFLWGDNTGQDNGGGGPFGQNWGTLNLAEDNEWIAQELARLATLAGVSAIPLEDVNFDGQVTGDGSGPAATDDVTAFIAGWDSVREINGLSTGDWISRQNGDLNFDGQTNLLDAFTLRQGLINSGLGSFDLSLLSNAAVPEPSCCALAMAGLIALAASRKRMDR